MGVLSDLSLITDSKGNILLYGKPATDLKYNRKNLSGKNIFFYINTNKDKNRILKEIEAKGKITFYFHLECSKNKTVPVLSRWLAFVEKPKSHVFYLILNNIINNPYLSEEKKLVGDFKEGVIWTSSSGLKDR